MFSLQNKKAVITGGGSGIGKAIAVLFAQQGAEVHIIELTDDSAKATVEEIAAAGGSVFSHACNVANQQDIIAECIQAVNLLYGYLDKFLSLAFFQFSFLHRLQIQLGNGDGCF